MLVLSRSEDQTIMIGDNIEVTVVDIRPDEVRIGINAPPDIAVHRKEVYDAIKRGDSSIRKITREQLRRRHGTPEEFRKACLSALGSFISVDEMSQAVMRYQQEWDQAEGDE